MRPNVFPFFRAQQRRPRLNPGPRVFRVLGKHGGSAAAENFRNNGRGDREMRRGVLLAPAELNATGFEDRLYLCLMRLGFGAAVTDAEAGGCVRAGEGVFVGGINFNAAAI